MKTMRFLNQSRLTLLGSRTLIGEAAVGKAENQVNVHLGDKHTNIAERKTVSVNNFSGGR